MSASQHTVSNGGAALVVDADPNATAPSEARIFMLRKSPVGAGGWWHAAEGGGPSFELWAKLTPKRWFKVAAAPAGATVFASVANVATLVEGGIVETPLFVRVTIAGGATALHVGSMRS